MAFNFGKLKSPDFLKPVFGDYLFKKEPQGIGGLEIKKIMNLKPVGGELLKPIPTIGVISPMGMAKTTPAIIGALPKEKVRLPFAKEKTITPPTIGLGPALDIPVKVGTDIGFRLLEIVPKAILQTIQNYRAVSTAERAGPLELPFDIAKRLGYKEGYIQSTGAKMAREYNKREQSNPSRTPFDVVKNALITSFTTTVPDAFDAVIAGDMVGLGAKVVLRATRYDPLLEKSLNELGITEKSFTLEEYKKRFTQTALEKSQQGDFKGLMDTIRAAKYVSDKVEGMGARTLNKFATKMEEMAKKLVIPLEQVQVRPLGAIPKGLPGFKPKFPGFKPGLTIEELEPVGKKIGLSAEELSKVVSKIIPKDLTKITPRVLEEKIIAELLRIGVNKGVAEEVAPEIVSQATPVAQKALKEAIPAEKGIIEPLAVEARITLEEEQRILSQEFQREANAIKKQTEGQLFRDIRNAGGIKSYRGKFMAEELSPVPLSLKNNKGLPLDEMAESLKYKGYNFDSDSDLLEAILAIRSEARRVAKPEAIRTIKTLRMIEKKMPEGTAVVSRRLLNKVYRQKYPKIPAIEKSVRRAIEEGRISLEFEGKTISEMRKIKGFVNPKSVPTERLSIFDNFINLNKIARKNVPYKQMGIARITRGDKTFPAIRQNSGFYATKEVETEPIKDLYDQLKSPYHMALAQDGYKLGGKFGVMFKKVWKPTQKAIRGEKEFSSIYFRTIKDIGKRYNIKATGKNLNHLSDVIERKVKATPQEELFIRDIRKVLDDLRNQANDIRQKMGKDEIGYITDYIPHIQKTTLWNELLSNVATISDNLDFIIPNAVRNPFAFRRMLEEMPKAERNLYILLDKYIRAISKDIYITPAIENIKAYNAVLKNRGMLNASKYWDEYIRTGLIGKQHKLDTALSIGQTGRRVLQKWNGMVNLAFLTGKVAWNVATQPLSYIMNTPMEAGIWNSIKAIYKSFGKPLRQYVKENSDVLAIKTGDVKAVAIGEGRNIQNRIYKTKIDNWNDFISMIGSVEERQLTLTSYIAGLDRAKNLGYKGQDALDFADLTAARTQSMYNKENRALILNSDIARTLFPFQSFSTEMLNHLKEIATKGGAEQLGARQRVGKLFRLLFGLYLANLYSKTLTGRKKTTVGTFFPFIGNYVDMLIAQATGQSYFGNRSPITVVQIGQDVVRGSRDFIEHGDLKRLRKIGINFGLALFGIGGGGQINNIIDGIMADIEEEVKNVKGDKMFEVKDAEDKVIAPFFGVWATKEGKDYFKPKEKKKITPGSRYESKSRYESGSRYKSETKYKSRY